MLTNIYNAPYKNNRFLPFSAMCTYCLHCSVQFLLVQTFISTWFFSNIVIYTSGSSFVTRILQKALHKGVFSGRTNKKISINRLTFAYSAQSASYLKLSLLLFVCNFSHCSYIFVFFFFISANFYFWKCIICLFVKDWNMQKWRRKYKNVWIMNRNV